MKNPIKILRNKRVVAIMAQLLDEKNNVSSIELAVSLNACLEKLKDKEIKRLFRDRVFDTTSTGLCMDDGEGNIVYVGQVPLVKALNSTDKELVESAERQFARNCKEIREYICSNYGF